MSHLFLLKSIREFKVVFFRVRGLGFAQPPEKNRNSLRPRFLENRNVFIKRVNLF